MTATATNTPGFMKPGDSTSGTSSSTQVLNSMHQDYIHHVSFDIYGRRMATCSGDRFVRVWDLTDTGEWALVGEWQAHRGSVACICWAHPEFGSLLATCGSDHEAKIWEERGMNNYANMTNAPMGSTSVNSRWTTKAQLTEARRAVSCCEFAPRFHGLKLATGSADGCVRIYEAVDVMNLAQWPLAATLACFNEGNSLGVTTLSWSTGRFEPATLVVGGPQVSVYRYSETARQWACLFTLPPPEPKGAQSLCVAWAPNVGRRFHYIASAEGQQLRIFKLSRGSSSAGVTESGGDGNKLELEKTQTLVEEVSNHSAWRCQWNVTGTVLASSGDRGVVNLWKSDFEGNFVCVTNIHGDVSQVAARNNEG